MARRVVVGAFLLRCIAGQFAETKVFDVTRSEAVGMVGGPAVAHDADAGCRDGAGLRRRFGPRCVAAEADALETCARLANCAAVVCLPARSFGDVPDLVGLDDGGAPVGAAAPTLKLWAAAAAGDGAGVAREIAAGGDVDAGDAVRARTP